MLKNLNIGRKLTIGFGILVLLTLVVVSISYLGSIPATENINRTEELRVPTAITSSRAQANLLRMLGDVRAYLASSDKEYWERYNTSRQAFLLELEELEQLSLHFDAENTQRLNTLKIILEQWSPLPEQLFELHNDQLKREPAYRLLMTDGAKLANTILVNIKDILESQSQREASTENMRLLEHMAKFQQTFTAMYSGLCAYAKTRNRNFKREYNINKIANTSAWQGIHGQKELLTADQQTRVDLIAQNHQDFLDHIPDQMFQLAESERWREDIYLFRTEAMPLALKMEELLSDITDDQQILLRTDLDTGQTGLDRANWLTRIGGVIALIFGVLLALFFRENIAGPVRRLTTVAEQICTGDLAAQAHVESKDEIGILAKTFNRMTTQLREILTQVRKEKKRADDLLEVVIPIGVELTSEKDYNRLLEKMLQEARTFCRADAGTLYLRNKDDQLEFVIVQNESRQIALGGTSDQKIVFPPLPLHDPSKCESGHCYIAVQVALSGISSNIPNYDRQSDILPDYHIISMLTIPLKNNLGQTLGVLQLLNAQDPDTDQIIPFDPNLQQMMESFSLLAVAALEAYIREQTLRQEIKRLRFEIDEVKRQKQVREIVESESFQDLQAKAAEMRRRRSKRPRKKDISADSDPSSQV